MRITSAWARVGICHILLAFVPFWPETTLACRRDTGKTLERKVGIFGRGEVTVSYAYLYGDDDRRICIHQHATNKSIFRRGLSLSVSAFDESMQLGPQSLYVGQALKFWGPLKPKFLWLYKDYTGDEG